MGRIGKRIVVLGACGSLWAMPATGQGAESPVPSPPETYATRGMLIGAASGGVLGGVGLGVLAAGLCEYECGGAFGEGFLYGFVGGGLAGGLTGLVIGAAIPRGGGQADSAGPAGPWSVKLSGGPNWAGDGVLRGNNLWAGVTVMRPTSERVRWGMETTYLGRQQDRGSFDVQNRDSTVTRIESRLDRRLWGFSLVAARSMGSGPTGPYLMASAGVYPTFEEFSITRGPDPLGEGLVQSSESDVEPYPGLGLGGGGLWSLGRRTAVGVEARLHLVLGAGDGPGLTLLTLAGALRLDF